VGPTLVRNLELFIAIPESIPIILNTMTRNTKKSPLEIANELELKAQRARARAVKAEASSHPILSDIVRAVADANADLILMSRKINGPNSFDNRTEALRLRLAWIEAERDYTVCAMAAAKGLRGDLQTKADMIASQAAKGLRGDLQTKADMIASQIARGEAVNFNLQQFVTDYKVSNIHLETLEVAMNLAENKWREFVNTGELKANAAS